MCCVFYFSSLESKCFSVHQIIKNENKKNSSPSINQFLVFDLSGQRLVELFGANRIMQLTYDELVNHQDSVIRKLKNFANIYIDPILAKRFHRVTHGKAKVTGGFETGHPRNAELNIDRWKTELSPAEIEQFTEYNNCKPIFDLIQARVANIKGPRYSNGRVNRSRHRDLFVKVD